jgi:HlyD family secretion protein
VHAGDTVATLVSSTLPDDLREREARVARAEADLRDLERGSRPVEIARAEAELRSAMAEDVRAVKELERMEALVAGKVVSQQDADNAWATAADARSKREAREQSLQLLRQGATREDGAPKRPIPGRIVAINHEAEYIPRVAFTTEERADLMFGIKVALSSDDGSARAGLPATVQLTTATTTTTAFRRRRCLSSAAASRPCCQ